MPAKRITPKNEEITTSLDGTLTPSEEVIEEVVPEEVVTVSEETIVPEETTVPEEVITPEPEAVITLVEGDEEEGDEEDEEEDGVTFNSAPTSKTAKERLVKIVTSRDHSCSIGGERYHFIKGKQYHVPLNVKRVLKKVNLLQPL